MSRSKILISRKRLIYEYIARPIAWGVGSAVLAWVGFVQVDLVWAFLVGLIVGIVHDGALYGWGVISYRRKLESIHIYSMFAKANRYYDDHDWEAALGVLLEIREYAPGYKEGHYLTIRCYDKMDNLEGLIQQGEEYLERYPYDSEVKVLVQHAYTRRAS